VAVQLALAWATAPGAPSPEPRFPRAPGGPLRRSRLRRWVRTDLVVGHYGHLAPRSERPNLQLALLRRLLEDRIRSLRRENVVESRRFSELFEEAIRRYQNRALTTAEIIAELVRLAKDLRDAAHRGEELGLRPAEVAFYDAIRQNEAAVLELGDETLKAIAQKLVAAVREVATIDWDVKETVRATMRAKVRRLLTQYGYPPDGQEQAVRLVIEQAELFAKAA